MARNTKEISLIQIRSGKLSEMPKALHQSEYGLAKDANRLFIGNASNTLLKNRTIFPYQNLEILTEFSNLKDYFKYSYENNIKYADGTDDRLTLKEFLPIVISCHASNPSITSAGSIKINGSDPIIIEPGDMYKFIETINNVSDQTNVYATVFPGTSVITFVSTANELKIEPTDPTKPTDTGIIDAIGFEEESYDVSMPIRNVTEKLDDRLDITDFGIAGDGTTNVAKQVFSSLIEVYKNVTDVQYYRNVFFPAGTYKFDDVSEDDNTPYFTPFPLISNLHVHGEGIDRTIISNNTNKSLLSCIDDKFYGEYANADYGKGGFPSNIVIEDMTFDSSNSTYLGRLIGCSNVTFNRVKFIGGNANTIFLVEGKEITIIDPINNNEIIVESSASNITFNNCIFENATTAVEISEMAKNITIHDCTFNAIGTPSLKIGNNNGNYGDGYDAYSSSETYVEGDRVKYDGYGWICNTNIETAEEWDESHWNKIDPINVKAVIVDDCHFTNSTPVASNTSVILLGTNSQYITTENCTFDKEIIEKSSARGTIPYKDNGIGSDFTSGTSYSTGDRCIFEHKYYIANTNITQGNDFDANQWDEYQRYNYTDILDINTDDKKILRFKFAQPMWEYINYLTNLNGEVVLTVDGKDEEITADNGLNIVENQNGIDIRSVKDGNVTLSMDSTSDLELGKGTTDITWKQNTVYELNDVVTHNGIIYTCTFPHTSGLEFNNEYWNETGITQIIIRKVLQLNDNLISNRMGSEDIKIEPATDKVIEIQQTDESTLSYEDKIIGKDNAIPNVAFVKKYSTDSIIKHITAEDVDSIGEDGLIELGSFLTPQFGENVHITGVTVNIRNPFYKVVPYLNTNSASYDEGYMYYRGDVVYGESGGTKYAVILKTQIAPNSTIDTDPSSTIMKVIPTTYTSDIKYVDVVGINNEGEYNLTQTYSPDYVAYKNDEFDSVYKIDIQKNNLFGYTDAEPLSTTETYGLDSKMVSFQDRNYRILRPNESEGYSGETYTALKLHKVNSTDTEPTNKRLYDEGFTYTFDEDRNYNIGNPNNENPYTVNYSAGKVCVRLYSDDGTLITSENKDTCLLNPAGDMVIKVDFVKEEL